jgi:hypothetical protein
MLNPDSASHLLVQFDEILKQVQDDKSRTFKYPCSELWNWTLFGIWYLVFGYWNFIYSLYVLFLSASGWPGSPGE